MLWNAIALNREGSQMKKSIVVCVMAMIAFFCFSLNPAHADKKYTTKVTVYKNGKPQKGYKVSLQFTGGVLSGGFTDNFYTNASGTAYVKHVGKGKVKVYVDGNWSKHKTKGRAPGRIDVHLSK